MKVLGFILALAVWACLLLYGVLAVTMGGCTAAEPGCDTTHTAGLLTVGSIGLVCLAALVWWFLVRKPRV